MKKEDLEKKYDFSDFDEAPEVESDDAALAPTTEVDQDSKLLSDLPEFNQYKKDAEASKDSLLSGLSGIARGYTMGAGDEISSGLSAGLGVLTDQPVTDDQGQLLENLSATDKYKNLFAEYLAAQQKHTKETEDKAPGMALAGDVIGSLSNPLNRITGSMVGKLEEGAKFADRALHASKLAALGAGSGVVEGFNRSEGDVDQRVNDAIVSGEFGAAIPLGLGATGEVFNLAGKAASKMIPERTKELARRGYGRGKDLIDVAHETFLPQNLKVASELSEEIADPLVQKAKTFDDARKLKINKINLDIEQKEQKIQKIKDSYIKAARDLKRAEISGNEKLTKTLNSQYALKSKELNGKINSIRGDIKKQYENVDKLMDKDTIKINTTDIVDNFINNIPEGVINKKRLDNLQSLSGDLDFTNFMRLKNELDSFSNHSDFGVKGLARTAYGQLRGSQKDSFIKQGRQDLADMMTSANERWTGYNNVQDFIDGVNVNSSSKSVEASKGTGKLIEKLGSSGRGDSIDVDNFKIASKAMGLADEELVPFQNYSNQLHEVDNFKPTNVPKIDEMIQQKPFLKDVVNQSNDEILALKQQAKDAVEKSELENQYSAFSKGPDAARAKVSSVLDQGTNPLMKIEEAEQGRNLQRLLSENVNPEDFTDLQKRASRVTEDLELGRIMKKEKDSVPLSKSGVANFAFGGLTKPIVSTANKMGLFSQKPNVREILEKFNAAKGSSGLSTVRQVKTFNALTDSNKEYTPIVNDSPQALMQKANDLVAANPSKANAMVASRLEKASTSDSVGKAAQLFDLQQRKEGRDALNTDDQDKEYDFSDFE